MTKRQEQIKADDQLVVVLLNSQREITKSMRAMEKVLIQINDRNAYHEKYLDNISKHVQNNGENIEKVCQSVALSADTAKQTNDALKTYGKIVMFILLATILALIVVAGAEESLHFLPKF